MQCADRPKRPLWRIIKSIGTTPAHNNYATSARCLDAVSLQYSLPTSSVRQDQPEPVIEPDSYGPTAPTTRDKSKAKRFDRAARHVSGREAQRRAARVEWQQKRRPELEQDWRDILELLASSTPSSPTGYQKQSRRALLPPGHRGYCKIRGEDFILEIPLRTGCHILDPPSNFTGPSKPDSNSRLRNGFKHITLSGTPDQIAHAMALLPNYLYMIDEHVPDRPLNIHLTAEAAPLYESSDAEKPPVVHISLQTVARTHLRVDTVISRRPSTWSTVAFANYVRDLTARRPRLMMRQASSNSRYTENMIANELKSLYIGVVNLTPFMSSEAVDMTLSWFLRRGEGRFPTVRQIVSFLETRSSHQMSASNYETLLGHAANNLDVHNFLYVVRTMLARGLRPTWRSFVHLYEMVSKRNPDQAGVILDRMKRKGVLRNPEALGKVAPIHVLSKPDDFFHGNLEDILATIDEDLDPTALVAGLTSMSRARRWLTHSSANVLCTRLLLRNRLDDVWKLLRELEVAGGKVDHLTVRLLLQHAKTRNSPLLAIEALRYVEERYGIQTKDLDWKAWGTLWRMAWRSRCFNLSRVIWRYACIHGHVDAGLQEAMEHSLFSFVPARQVRKQLSELSTDASMPDGKPLGMSSLFFGWVAKFCVGIYDGRGVKKRPDGDTSPDLSRKDRKLLGLTSGLPVLQESEIQRRYRLCGSLLRADQVQDLFVPQKSFTEVLEEAWRKDQAWLDPRHRPYGEALTLQWTDFKDLEPEERNVKLSQIVQRSFERMLREAVHVPVSYNTMTYREGMGKWDEIYHES